MRDQHGIIDLMNLADPAKDLDVTVPAVSPRGADEGASIVVQNIKSPRRRADPLALVGGFAAFVLVAVGALVFVDPLGRPDPATAATPPLLAFQFEEDPPSAQKYLMDIANGIADDDESDSAGLVTYIHTEAWSLDISAEGGETTSVVIPWAQEIWHAPDSSALRKVTRPSSGPEAELPEWTKYEPGEWNTATPTPPSAELAELRAQIYASHPQENGIRSAIRGVADLYQGWVIPSSVRAQIMRFLAEHEDLKYRGQVTDRAGRTGIAITADSGSEQDIIVLDEESGQMLSYESVIVSGAQALVDLPAVYSYVLLLDAELVADIPNQ